MIALEDKLYDLAMAYWDLQTHNYDIELNNPELLDFDFEAPDLATIMDDVITRSRQLFTESKPRAEPVIDSIFREDIAAVPNNSVVNVVMRAIMAGGPEFDSKADGWKKRKKGLAYEIRSEKAGLITVTIDSDDPEAVVKSLGVFTLDVLVGVMGHLIYSQNKDKPPHPLSLKTVVTAKQLLLYKHIRSHGERRWNLIEKISSEIEKLQVLRIEVKDALIQGKIENYKGSLFAVQPVKRVFNPHTKRYVCSSWDIMPGNWVMYLMSKDRNWFVGKMSREVLQFDHREQRSAESFAKKLVYSLFVIPGGTHYLNFGAKKPLIEYLKLIGEYYEKEDSHRNRNHRSLKRMAAAIDLLVNRKMVTISMEGNVSEYIRSLSKPWSMRKILEKVIEIKPGPALTCPT